MQHQMDEYGMEMDDDMEGGHRMYGDEDMMGEGSEGDHDEYG